MVSGGGLSTFYFDSLAGTVTQQVTAVANFLVATDDRRSSGLTWAIENDVAQLNAATGALEGVSSGPLAIGVGTGAGDPLPPNAQGLLQIFTNVIAGGRLLRGRLFLPGSMEADSQVGAPNNTYITDYNAAGAALIADPNTLWVVWSRTNGSAHNVTAVNTWTKWATLTGRRD